MRTRSQNQKATGQANTLTSTFQVSRRPTATREAKAKQLVIPSSQDKAARTDGVNQATVRNGKGKVKDTGGLTKNKVKTVQPLKQRTKHASNADIIIIGDKTLTSQTAHSAKTPADTNTTSFTTSQERYLPADLLSSTYTPTRDDPTSMRTRLLIRMPTPADFSFSGTVCSYGYFCLPPQSWIPSTDKDNADGGVFERPLRYGYNYSETVYVRITLLRQRVDGVDQPALQVEEVLHGVKRDTPVVFSTLTQGHLAQIGMQVTRMFRLDEDISAFHAMQNEAKERGFGRLYRSPSTFEDMIKSITNSNMTWAGTVRMCALLCFHYGKRGAFPTPQEMPTSADELKTKCKVGYRGDRMLQVAALFLTPPEDLSAFDNTGEADMKTLPTPDPLSTPTKQKAAAKRARKTQEKLEKRRKNLVLVKRLVQADNPRLVVGDSQLVFALIKSLHGFGDFAASNVMQLMGYYDHLAADSETVRLFKEHHVKEIRTHTVGTQNYNDLFRIARKYYDQYAPYQFLFYWFDLWKNYEEKSGKEATKWVVERMVITQTTHTAGAIN